MTLALLYPLSIWEPHGAKNLKFLKAYMSAISARMKKMLRNKPFRPDRHTYLDRCKSKCLSGPQRDRQHALWAKIGGEGLWHSWLKVIMIEIDSKHGKCSWKPERHPRTDGQTDRHTAIHPDGKLRAIISQKKWRHRFSTRRILPEDSPASCQKLTLKIYGKTLAPLL